MRGLREQRNGGRIVGKAGEMRKAMRLAWQSSRIFQLRSAFSALVCSLTMREEHHFLNSFRLPTR